MSVAPLETRLFHAIVLVGAALGAGCGPLDGACTESISDAAADAKLSDASPDPCPVAAPPNPIETDAAAAHSLPADAAPDVQPWPPTKC